jgi:type II secretory pathway pseudopilin PulG
MLFRMRDNEGFGLVEVVIAVFLLGIIAVALLPVLWNGIVNSTRQSAAATATRELNSLIEDARDVGTCAALDGAAAAQSFHAGTPQAFDVRLPAGFVYICTPGTAVPITLEALQGTTVLATVQAKVYVP